MDFLCRLSQNFTNSPLFCFGIGVGLSFLFKVQIPRILSKACTSYLLLAIGSKAGTNLRYQGDVSTAFLASSSLMVAWGVLQTFLVYWVLKKWTSLSNATAAATAACFGSISLITFITATQHLEKNGIFYEPFTIALMGLMEAPGLLAGLAIAYSQQESSLQNATKVVRLAFCNKSILLLVGGGAMGFILAKLNLHAPISAFQRVLPSALCLFLFDMGLQIGQNKEQFKKFNPLLIILGVVIPFISSFAGLAIGRLLELDMGTTILIAVLCASASYIAVPAAMRMALPEAQESTYLTISLGIAFPFNILLGIPIYTQLAQLSL